MEEADSQVIGPVVVCKVDCRVKKPKQEGKSSSWEKSHIKWVWNKDTFYLTTEYSFVIIIMKLWLFLLNLPSYSLLIEFTF